MGEFGRTPQIGTQGSTDGRNHWPYVMSMSLAGGGFRHGQVIGASDADGGQIQERPVTPGDLAATIYHHIYPRHPLAILLIVTTLFALALATWFTLNGEWQRLKPLAQSVSGWRA